jgi:hypothetical protein
MAAFALERRSGAAEEPLMARDLRITLAIIRVFPSLYWQ